MLLSNYSVVALEFKREADKAEWIKNFFKDKEAAPFDYADEVTKEEIKFREQLIKDFITQNGIEHLEPIAIGKITDPEIAKFNIACPDKKPIYFYKRCCSYGRIETYCEPEEKLDDPELANSIEEYKCSKDSNIKIYKFNVSNSPDNKQDYVLYCDDFVLLRSKGTIFEEPRERPPSYIEAAYLQFDPKKCVYSEWIGPTMYTQQKNFLAGIFNNNGKYYFYVIKTGRLAGDKYDKTSLDICGNEVFDGSYCCGKDYYNKNEVSK